MPTDDRHRSERDDFESRRSARDRRGQRDDGADDPYRRVRRRLSDRARRGEDPFAAWLGNDESDGEKAWWELPDEPPLLPDARNWRPGTIVGHRLPRQYRLAIRSESALRTPSLTGPAVALRDQLSALGSQALADPWADDDSLTWDARTLFDDWSDEQQRRPKKPKKPSKRQRRDGPTRDRHW